MTWTRRQFSALAGAAPLAAAASPIRIAIGGISHETNAFAPTPTDLKEFDDAKRGEKILEGAEKANTTVSGFVEGCREANVEMVPLITASATPAGFVTAEAFESLTGELLDRLKKAGPVQGVLLSLHGAMITKEHPHADAEVVRRVRELVGPNIPIGVTHDFHANVSEEIVKHSTALNTYKLCPHLDPRERGIQMAKIIAQAARGEVKPVQAIAKPPMVYNILFHDTNREPFRHFVEESRRLEQNPKILAVSVPAGYQWGDVPAMGPSAIVVTDNDPELARSEAERLSKMLWDSRDKIRLNLPSVEEAVRMARESDKFPVALIDAGDNIGGGSAGDSTFILAELIRQKAEGWVVVIADPAAVKAAAKAGIGGSFDMPVGGKIDNLHGKPVPVKGTVKLLSDGRYIEPEVRHGGARYWSMGQTAVIQVTGSTLDLPNLIVLTKERSSPNSIHQLTSNGIYPERMRILVVKGCIAPRAAYEPVAAKLIEVDSPGVCAVNPARFQFKKIRPNLFGMNTGKG